MRKILLRFNEEGISGLADRPRRGRPRKTNERYVALLKQAVSTDPREQGYVFGCWTLGRLREHLGRRTRILLSVAHLAAHGGARNRLSPTQAWHDSSSRSPGIPGKESLLELCQKKALFPEAVFDLLYLDECEVHLHPTLTKVWTLRGVRPIVPAAGINRKLCVYGALNYRTVRHYLVHPRKNARQFEEFLRQLLEAHSERCVVLVLDNASYHRTHRILELLDAHADHVFVIWLPRYSPELNLIEGLWGYLKRSALNNYYYGDMRRWKKRFTKSSELYSEDQKQSSPSTIEPLQTYGRPLSASRTGV